MDAPATSDPSTPDVSVICPMYNEGASIRENIGRLMEALERRDGSWELILVDDGSTDDGGGQVADLALSEPRLRLLGYPRNRGRGYALRTGFRHEGTASIGSRNRPSPPSTAFGARPERS